jgi:Lysozyme like domain
MTSCSGGGGTGTLYTYAQLEGLWINAGGTSSMAPVMAAIAEAESGGCSTALNPSGASGLWQILGAVDASDQAHLFDPATNAKEAVLKYKSQGLDAWETYTNGAYKGFLSNGTSPDTSVPGSSSSSTATPATTASYNTADCLFGFPGVSVPVVGNLGGFCILSKTNARAMLGGVLMLGGGLVLMVGALIVAAGAFSETSTGQKAGRAVKKAAEVAPFIAALLILLAVRCARGDAGIPAAEVRRGGPRVGHEIVAGFVAGVPLENRLAAGQDLVGVDAAGAALPVDQITLCLSLGVDPDTFTFGLDFHPLSRAGIGSGLPGAFPFLPLHVGAVAPLELGNNLELGAARLRCVLRGDLGVMLGQLLVRRAAQLAP